MSSVQEECDVRVESSFSIVMRINRSVTMHVKVLLAVKVKKREGHRERGQPNGVRCVCTKNYRLRSVFELPCPRQSFYLPPLLLLGADQYSTLGIFSKANYLVDADVTCSPLMQDRIIHDFSPVSDIPIFSDNFDGFPLVTR